MKDEAGLSAENMALIVSSGVEHSAYIENRRALFEFPIPDLNRLLDAAREEGRPLKPAPTDHGAELLPCPFCGGPARMVWEPGTTNHRGSCFRCGATFHWFATEPEAITAWNTRSSGQKPFDDGVRDRTLCADDDAAMCADCDCWKLTREMCT